MGIIIRKDVPILHWIDNQALQIIARLNSPNIIKCKYCISIARDKLVPTSKGIFLKIQKSLTKAGIFAVNLFCFFRCQGEQACVVDTTVLSSGGFLLNCGFVNVLQFSYSCFTGKYGAYRPKVKSGFIFLSYQY